MTLDELRALADTWGGDVERWPEAHRAAARDLAATPAGAAILQAAGQLDRLLAARPEVSGERARDAAHQVVFRIAREAQTGVARRRRWDFSDWLVPAASLACSALVGVSLAMALQMESDAEPIVLGMILDSGSMAAGWMLQ
jgi:hypothetical protein